ncbi:hypothetical protein [Allosphingosinicella vermicomposti]|uniref:hypothetical protein n=1 Tax=Allosphingosinicella vermicomposti TaxID=614671 RepID=UPI000D0F06BB|nr:hypothetical protein [Allosphingosinicella vermicomposti]
MPVSGRSEKRLRFLAVAIAALILSGEVARWWGNPRFIPLAFEEILIAAALIWAALTRRFGTLPLVAAWALLAGHMLSLLVPTLDHLLFGPPKAKVGFYTAALSIMLAIALFALGWAMKLTRNRSAQ